MNQIFKQLPTEIVKDNIFSYLDTKTKMKLKYREIEKYECITKELYHIDINKFNRLYKTYYSRLNSFEKVIATKVLRECDNNIDSLLVYYIEKYHPIFRNIDGIYRDNGVYFLIMDILDRIKKYAYYNIEYTNNSVSLKHNTIKELKQLCKMNNLKRYSKLRKNELIRLLLSV